MRIADCGLRIAESHGEFVRRDAHRENPQSAIPNPQWRNPKSAIRNLLLFVAACTPATTRPAFAPYPEALHAVINARPARVAEEAQQWLTAQGSPVALVSPVDGFVETRWHEATDSTGARMRTRIRVWADPDVPGKSRVTVEAVYRPIEDPSRMPRDLEQPCPPGSVGQQLAERLLAALSEKFGVTKY